MSTPELATDRIKSLYAVFRKADPWPAWLADFRGVVESFRAMDDATFASLAAQERLWRARGVSGIGPGEAVGCEGAYSDPEIVAALAEVRTRRWPDEPNARARAVQDAYDRILALVTPKHASLRPQAKLARAFAALLPDQMHTAFSWESHRDVVKLLLGSRKVQPVEGGVLARARLRAALGDEADLDESIRRAQFCWWLRENIEPISRGEDPVVAVPAPVEPIDGPKPKPEPIALWPIAKQRKGLTTSGGFVDALRAVVVLADQGAAADDLVESLRADAEYAHLAPKTCRALVDRARWFGFLQHRDGLWRPSPEGDRLVQEDPPEVLTEKLVVRVFGIAHLIRELRGGPLVRTRLVARLQSIYPRWTSEIAPSMLLGWCTRVGMVERAGSLCTLTEYGRAWEARLPETLAVPDGDDGDELEPDEDVAPVASSAPWPGLPTLLSAFRADPDAKHLVFDDAQVRSLHIAWHCHPNKRFVLLSGLSGTGKTALLTNYARLYLGQLGLDPKRHLAIVPVSPDWRDPSGLLGYFNALHADPTFQAEPALRLVIAAARNPSQPYFLVLDEMNLARVELYFAPFLSAMETGGELALHAHDETVNSVPPSVPWPKNLFVGGTVNMDETTHPFSDKVLDRAFTMEFWDVDLGRFFERRAARTGRRSAGVEAILTDVHRELRRVRRHFGYRTADEVLDFLDHAASMGLSVDAGLIDDAVFAKVLPRLRGEDSPALHEVLGTLGQRCAASGLQRCAAKLDEMRDRLKTSGVTRFWA